MLQRNTDGGVKEPVFDSVKLNIKNADLWTEINAERAAEK